MAALNGTAHFNLDVWNQHVSLESNDWFEVLILKVAIRDVLVALYTSD